MTTEKILEILRNELSYFVTEYGIKKIGLFGSYAKGIQRPDSDVDILVEFERPIGFKFIEFGEYLEKILGKKIDILTPTGIRAIRIKQIAKDIEENIIYV